MKKLIALICIASLTGCGLFRKTVKESHNSELKTEQGNKKEINEVDTGSTHTKELWKFRIPYLLGGNGNNNNYPDPGASSSTDSDQRATIASLRAALNEMMLKNGNMSGTIGFMEAELTRFINESRGKTTNTKSSDTLSTTTKTTDNSVKKTPAIPWYLYLIAFFSGVIIWDVVKWISAKLFRK